MKLVSLVKKFVIVGLFFVSSNAVYGYDLKVSLPDVFEGVGTKFSNDPIFWGGCAAASGLVTFLGGLSAYLEKDKKIKDKSDRFITIIAFMSLLVGFAYICQKDYSAMKKVFCGCLSSYVIFLMSPILFFIGYAPTDYLFSNEEK